MPTEFLLPLVFSYLHSTQYKFQQEGYNSHLATIVSTNFDFVQMLYLSYKKSLVVYIKFIFPPW